MLIHILHTISHPTRAACYACDVFPQPPNPAPPSAKCSPKFRKMVRKVVRKHVRKMFHKIFRKKKALARKICSAKFWCIFIVILTHWGPKLGPQTGSEWTPPGAHLLNFAQWLGPIIWVNHLGEWPWPIMQPNHFGDSIESNGPDIVGVVCLCSIQQLKSSPSIGRETQCTFDLTLLWSITPHCSWHIVSNTFAAAPPQNKTNDQKTIWFGYRQSVT